MPFRESEAIYSDIVELANDGIAIVQDMGLRFVNQPLAAMLDAPIEELVGKDATPYIRPADLPRLIELYARFMSGERGLGNIETELVSRAGRKIPVEVKGQVIRFKGTPSLLLNIRDVSARVEAERALRESEEAYRSLVQNVNVGVYRNTVGGGGRFLRANPAIARMFGYDTVDAFMEVSVADLYQDPDDRARFVEKLMAQGGVIRNEELRLKRRDGTPIWASVSAQVKRGDDGAVRWTDGVIIDVTDRRRAEQDLRENREFLDTVVENIPNMICVKTADDLRFVRFNKAGEELLGYTREDLLGKNDYDFFPKGDADFFVAKDREVLESGELLDIPEEPIETRDKGARVLHTKKIPILDDAGRPRYLLGISEDITERKLAEAAFRRSEERYRTLVEASTDIIYETDISGHFTYVNPVCTRILGYQPEELQGRHFLELVPPSHRKQVGRFYNRQFRDREPSTFCEFPVAHLDGHFVWVAQNVQLNVQDGRLTGFQAVARDVTDRKRAEEALKESEETARALLNAPNEMGILLDRNGSVIALNEFAARTLGRSPEEIIGHSAIELIPPALADSTRRIFRQAIRRGQPRRFEQAFGDRWFDVSIYPVGVGGESISRVALFMRDVTRHKRVEEKLRQALGQARDADLLKSRFLANMSHEIRSPLNAIIGLTTILSMQEDMDEGDRQAYYRNIQYSAESLLAMINAILGLAKSESGAIEPRPVPFEPADLLEKLRRRFAPQMETKMLEFACDIDAATPDTVVGDPVLIEQVLGNLIGNAFKFTDEGSVSVGLAPERPRGDRLVLHFRVADTGAGIPKEQQRRVFQAFFQIDGSSTREHQGTGLGLAIAAESVRLMKGKIWLKSEEGAGSTFHVTVPVLQGEGDGEAETQQG